MVMYVPDLVYIEKSQEIIYMYLPIILTSSKNMNCIVCKLILNTLKYTKYIQAVPINVCDLVNYFTYFFNKQKYHLYKIKILDVSYNEKYV